jgi:hypothetical protein
MLTPLSPSPLWLVAVHPCFGSTGDDPPSAWWRSWYGPITKWWLPRAADTAASAAAVVPQGGGVGRISWICDAVAAILSSHMVSDLRPNWANEVRLTPPLLPPRARAHTLLGYSHHGYNHHGYNHHGNVRESVYRIISVATSANASLCIIHTNAPHFLQVDPFPTL